MLNLEPIKERLLSSSHWGYFGYSDQSLRGLGFIYTAVDEDSWRTIAHRVSRQDGEFIARAPQDIAALVAEVERLRKQQDAFSDLCDGDTENDV